MLGQRPSLLGLLPQHLIYPFTIISSLTLLPCVYLFNAPIQISVTIWLSAIGAWYLIAGKYQKYVAFMQMLKPVPKGYFSGHIRYKPLFSKRVKYRQRYKSIARRLP
jgi:hypothetical protein